jgi:methylglutaconyl-CoA hydratase
MTAEYQHVQVERRGPALWVTLNRPAVRNAFNPAMIAELTALFTGVEGDGETRVVVLAGAGAVFCAGADLTWMREMAAYTHDENVADALRLADLCRGRVSRYACARYRSTVAARRRVSMGLAM